MSTPIGDEERQTLQMRALSVRQPWTEDFGGLLMYRCDQVRDGASRPFEAILVTEPFEDSGFGVSLFARFRLIILEPLLDQRDDRIG